MSNSSSIFSFSAPVACLRAFINLLPSLVRSASDISQYLAIPSFSGRLFERNAISSRVSGSISPETKASLRCARVQVFLSFGNFGADFGLSRSESPLRLRPRTSGRSNPGFLIGIYGRWNALPSCTNPSPSPSSAYGLNVCARSRIFPIA